VAYCLQDRNSQPILPQSNSMFQGGLAPRSSLRVYHKGRWGTLLGWSGAQNGIRPSIFLFVSSEPGLDTEGVNGRKRLPVLGK
jgi:hypothetical protein